MKCKHCNVLLDEGVNICPVCGKRIEAEEDTTAQMPDLELDEAGEANSSKPADQAPELTPLPQNTVGKAMNTESKRTKKSMIFLCVLGVIFSVILVVGAVVGILFALDILPPRENDIHYRENYTVSDEKVLKNANKIVASFWDETLTNGKLQMYYWMYVSDFLYENRYYLSSLGLNYTKPLDEQKCYFDESLNWEQAFLEFALDDWYRYTCLYKLALNAGFKLDDDMEALLQQLPEDMEEDARDYGYKDLNEMLKAELGPTCTIEMYVDYMRVYYTGVSYFTEIYEAINPTMEEIEAYFAENEALLASQKITKESGYYVDVRHILLEPVDADKDGTISDAEWETCRQNAQVILDQWLAGDRTEESFAALANQHSADPGSNTKGGLYTAVAEGKMVEEFDDWIFDESRQVKDYGLIKTSYGYHIMFFSGTEDIWIYQSREGIREERATPVLKNALEANPLEVDYKKIVLCDITLSN